MDIFATSTTQNSPSHVAEKNKSSFLTNFRRNVGFPVPYEQDGGGDGIQLQRFAVLEAGPSAPGL